MADLSAGREHDSNSSYLNKSLDKALSILDLFDTKNTRLSVTEIAKKFDSNPSSFYPILHTLEKHGYLKRDGDKQYSLGLTFPKKGRLVLDELNIATEARAELERLRDSAQKTVHLGYLSGNQIVYIDKVESRSGIRMYSSPGKTAPVHATALGKAIRAYLPEDRVDRVLNTPSLCTNTPSTVTSIKELKFELEKIRDRGFALDDEEFEEGIKCVAAPIRRYDGSVEAAISLTGLAAKMGKEKLDELSMLVMNHARNISSKLACDTTDTSNNASW